MVVWGTVQWDALKCRLFTSDECRVSRDYAASDGRIGRKLHGLCFSVGTPPSIAIDEPGPGCSQ